MSRGTLSARPQLRRSREPLRVELTPLIDAVFLLLTFFIYAMVLMERIELVPMELKTLESGSVAQEQAQPAAITLSLDADGNLFLDREPIAIGALVPALETALAARSDTVLYLAVSDEVGPNDRIPVLLDVWDRLRNQPMPVKMVGKPPLTAPDPGVSTLETPDSSPGE
ncbi:MAG: biopolymer transporter ExbD [Phycisphaerales bacterium]|nr:biopolymer transporter ExbD [Phycisphaerales bacterium]